MPGYRRPCSKSSGEHCRPLKKLKSSHEEDDRATKIESTKQERKRVVVKVAKRLKSTGQNCPRCKKPKSDEDGQAKEKDGDLNWDDPQLCAPYASDIWEYLHSLEEESKSKSFDFHSDCDMRNTMVEWLVHVGDRYQFTSRTLSLAVSYLDRFLSKTNCDKLCLLAVSCLLLASKYEDIRNAQPLVGDICSIIDYTYTNQQVVEMEAHILKSLNFQMGYPTIITFLERFTPVAQKKTSPQFDLFVSYFAELSFLCFGCTRFLPSMVAASVIFLAKFTLQPKVQPWCLALEQCTGYRASQIKECIFLIHDFHCKTSSMDRARNKYQRPELDYVAHSEIPTLYFEDV